jgi:ribonuclease HI
LTDLTPHKLLTGIQYLINSTVIYTRENIKAGSKIDDVAKLICKSTIARMAHVAPASLTKSMFPESRFTEEDLHNFAKKVKTFGASGKRSQEQTKAAAAHAEKLVKTLSANTKQIWTDGSKLGKGSQGPTGAGAMIIDTGADAPTHLLKYHLGVSTNQVAELWAIGGALTTIRDENLTEDTEIHIFSDSDFSIKCITGVYASQKLHSIIKHITALVEQFPKNTVHFHHVAGHAGIPGNDIADDLANTGAQYSKKHLTTHNLTIIIETHGFNHQLIIDDNYGECNLINGFGGNSPARGSSTLLF